MSQQASADSARPSIPLDGEKILSLQLQPHLRPWHPLPLLLGAALYSLPMLALLPRIIPLLSLLLLFSLMIALARTLY